MPPHTAHWRVFVAPAQEAPDRPSRKSGLNQRASALAQRRVCGDAVFLRDAETAGAVWIRREALHASATPVPLTCDSGALSVGRSLSDLEWARNNTGEAAAPRGAPERTPADATGTVSLAARGSAADLIASLERMSRGAEVRHQMLGFIKDPETGKLIALDELSSTSPRGGAPTQEVGSDGADALLQKRGNIAAAETVSMDAAQCYHFVRRNAVAAVAAHVRALGSVPAHGSQLDALLHVNGVNLALMPLVRDDAASPPALRDVIAVQMTARALACVMWSRASHELATEGTLDVVRTRMFAQFCTDALGAWAPDGHVTATSAQLWSVGVRSELLLGPCGRDGALQLRADEAQSPRLVCASIPHWLAVVGPVRWC